LRVETAPLLMKVLLARLPNCTQAPRTLGQALPVTRSSGGALTGGRGGGHSHDPRWPAEEWPDDDETWGKTTAQS
jgi:hypothetical protein